VPIASFGAEGSLAEWRARADVSALFNEAMATHRIDPEQRGHAEQLVWAAYKKPVALPGGGRLEGFAAAASLVREMDFVYPIPAASDPALGGPDCPGELAPRDGSSVPSGDVRGYVRGSLDLAFEEVIDGQRLTYFADWKSDSLASYAPDALARHVAGHYEEQVRLYTLAVVRLLGVRSRADHAARFGGLLYCFLRGFDGEGGGLFTARPSWEEIVAWDERLRDRRFWAPAADLRVAARAGGRAT
jgi:exodeoxyribonuclease V beta subunit